MTETTKTTKATDDAFAAIRLLSVEALRIGEMRAAYGEGDKAAKAARTVRIAAYALFGQAYAAKTSGAKAMSGGAAWTAIAADAAAAFAATDFADLATLTGETIGEGVDLAKVAESVRDAIAETTIRQYAPTSAWIRETFKVGEYVPTMSEGKVLKAKSEGLAKAAKAEGQTIGEYVKAKADAGTSPTKLAATFAAKRRDATASTSSAKAVDKAIAAYIAAAGVQAEHLATLTAALRGGQVKADKVKAIRAAVKVTTDKAAAMTSALQAADAKAAKPRAAKGKAA